MSSPNPYEPPRAAVADQGAVRGAPVKGMVYGVLVDIGGSIALGIALTFLWAIWLAASGLDAEAIEETLRTPDPTSTLSIVSYVIGSAFSWLGGYVCARVAKETEMRCAAVVATISTLVGLFMGSSLPFEINLLLALVSIGMILHGAWIGARRNRRPS